MNQGTYANHGCPITRDEAKHLLDVVTFTALGLAVSPGRAADVAADTAADADANGLAVLDILLSLGAVNGDEVTGQVVLAAERATTGLVVASIGLCAVGVMGLDVSLQVEGAGEGCAKR